MAQLLDAAETIFAEVGYHAASTNAIAREAGVSPGTLYQFFPNKKAIAAALSARLTREMDEVHGTAFSIDPRRLPLSELLDQVIDPLIDFNLRHPACFSLLSGPDLPRRVSEDHDLLDSKILSGVKDLIAARAPHLDQQQLGRTADVCFATVLGVLRTLFEKPAEEQRALMAELKKLLYRYLAPLVGETLPHAGSDDPSAPSPGTP